MSLSKPNPTATLTLGEADLRYIEDALQAHAVRMLQNPEPGQSSLDIVMTPLYRQNRTLFGKVWDALNSNLDQEN